MQEHIINTPLTDREVRIITKYVSSKNEINVSPDLQIDQTELHNANNKLSDILNSIEKGSEK